MVKDNHLTYMCMCMYMCVSVFLHTYLAISLYQLLSITSPRFVLLAFLAQIRGKDLSQKHKIKLLLNFNVNKKYRCSYDCFIAWYFFQTLVYGLQLPFFGVCPWCHLDFIYWPFLQLCHLISSTDSMSLLHFDWML